MTTLTKLLGRFPKPVAYEYQELLRDQGIEAEVLDTTNASSSYARLGTDEIELYTHPGNEEQAKAIIDRQEAVAQASVLLMAKDTNRLMRWIFLSIIVVILVVLLVIFSMGGFR